jgi:hypothetical protein
VRCQTAFCPVRSRVSSLTWPNPPSDENEAQPAKKSTVAAAAPSGIIPSLFIFRTIRVVGAGCDQPMSVRRTHGLHQASRGGFNGLDASGRALLSAGQERRCRSGHGRERRRRCPQRFEEDRDASGHWCQRRARRAHVALVSGAARIVVTSAMIVVLVAVVVQRMLVGRTACRRWTIAKRVNVQRRRRAQRAGLAQHGCGHRAPGREQECQHHQQPSAKCSHEAMRLARGD